MHMIFIVSFHVIIAVILIYSFSSIKATVKDILCLIGLMICLSSFTVILQLDGIHTKMGWMDDNLREIKHELFKIQLNTSKGD